MNFWQLSTGPTDEEHIMYCINTNDITKPFIFTYEKGRAKMKDIPKFGDIVLISLKSTLIARGTIYREFYDHNGALFADILINKIIFERPYLCGYRRNWIKITEDQYNIYLQYL